MPASDARVNRKHASCGRRNRNGTQNLNTLYLPRNLNLRFVCLYLENVELRVGLSILK